MLLVNWQIISFGSYIMIYVKNRVINGWREGEKVTGERGKEGKIYIKNVAKTKNNVGRLSF